MHAFIGRCVRTCCRDFDDQAFAMDLLEQKHVLIAPGVSFNVPYRNYFRITNLPNRECWPRSSERIGRCSMSTRRMQPPQSDRI